MSIAQLPVTVDPGKIAEFCRTRGVRKLSLFGSVLRDDFDPSRSDVDVLVEFLPGRAPAWEFFRFGEFLSDIFGRKVDCNTPAMLSKHFREEVLREAVAIYEQA